MIAKSIFEIFAIVFFTTVALLTCCSSNEKQPSDKTQRNNNNNKAGKNRSKKKPMLLQRMPPAEQNKKIEDPTKVTGATQVKNENEKPKEMSKKESGNKDGKKEGGGGNGGAGEEGVKTKTQTIDVDTTHQNLDASKLPKLDKTMVENIHTPAVHDRATKIAIERAIIDPKHSRYGGNIDMLSVRSKTNKMDVFEKELENHKSEATVEVSKKDPNCRVKVREDKCLVFETNEVPTDDEEEEPQQQDPQV